MNRRHFLFVRVGVLRLMAALACVLPVSLKAQNDAGPRAVADVLDQFRRTYESEAATLQRQAMAADAQWLVHYGEAVTRFTQEAQARGEFEAWQAGSRERERFSKTRAITAAELVQGPEALRTLQQRALEGRIEVRRKAARDTVDLTERLVARLEALTRELTIRGDAEGARQSIDAVARVRAHEIYSEALFSLDSKEPFPALYLVAIASAAETPATASAAPDPPAPFPAASAPQAHLRNRRSRPPPCSTSPPLRPCA